MKKILYKTSAILSISILSSSVAISTAYAADYANPSIKPILPVLKSSTPIAPNIFLMLDDSGSMDGAMPYDSNVTYEIPPNPKDFDVDVGNFKPFKPLAFVNKNGFAANGLLSENFYRNGCFSNDQNCRNFLAFYSTRMLALKSSLAIALNRESGTYSLDHDFINDDNLDQINLVNMNRKNASAFRTNMKDFLTSLYGIRANGYTPVRNEVLKLYNAIRSAAVVNSVDNLFLPENSITYDSKKLLSCKQNYSIILSDGDYNGSIGRANHLLDDYDSLNHNWTLQQSSATNNTVDTPIAFRGDGSQPEQRLFAGGLWSLQGETEWVRRSLLNWNDPRIVRRNNGSRNCRWFNDNRFYCQYASSTKRLTDIVLKGWAEDLNPTLIDNVKPQIDFPGDKQLVINPTRSVTLPEVWNPENDPANWQRIVTYTIGLGLGNEWTDSQMGAVINGTSPWINNFPDGTHQWRQNARRDFVRSGYVGRGGFNRVDSPQELVSTFSDIFAEAIRKSGTSSNSGTTSSATQITTQSSAIVFSTEVDPGDRSGNIKGTWMYNGIIDDPSTPAVDEGALNGGVEFCYGQATPPAGAFAGQLCTVPASKWDAIEKMPDWNSRNIISYNPTTKSGIVFDYSEMDTKQKTYFIDLFSPSKITSILTGQVGLLINFIKGDDQLITSTHPDIRSRPDGKGPNKTPLGDFGRGGPAFLGAPNKVIWGGTLTTAEKNRAFAFVGANDGMLHAFNAISGEEVFAYIPNAVYKNFENLILPNKPHTAFVDGQIATKDIDNKKTILVSGMGAGGKGLFALDVTNPNAFNKDKVLWEIDESIEPRLGKIFGKPSIIRVEGKYKGKDDRWVVVVGTGYGNNNSIQKNGVSEKNKSNGILVLDALDGEILQFLELPSAKGVGEITWIDHQKQKNPSTFKPYYDNDSYWGEVDRGYVGDLKGNVWLLDFAYDKSKTETTLRSAIVAGGDNDLNRLTSEVKEPKPEEIGAGQPAPLFIATDKQGNRQPITAPMKVLQHPSNRGYMVYFGTGELFNIDPFQPDVPNSMYGVWDDVGDNYGDISTADVEDNNKTRARFYLTYYPWKSITTTFLDSSSNAFARVPASDRTPLVWANFQGKGDSATEDVAKPDLRTEPSSGWVVDTGENTAGQYERVFQPPYTVINEYKEEGINFSMSTLTENSDPCSNESGAYTWNMTFRTDVIDGPFAAFTTSQTDNNRDGKITEADNIVTSSNGGANTTGVALGAILSKDITSDGIPSLVFNPTVVQSPRGGLVTSLGAGDFCPSGTARSYKKALSSENLNEKIVEEVNICIPSTMSSWSEIE